MGNLPKLSELYLFNNQLKEIPESISYILTLLEIDLFDNPLEVPPIQIAEEGIDAIREYFQHSD
jgi:Leucine-rich repeat (LRR) protein